MYGKQQVAAPSKVGALKWELAVCPHAVRQETNRSRRLHGAGHEGVAEGSATRSVLPHACAKDHCIVRVVYDHCNIHNAITKNGTVRMAL